jgi:hypothetical protein
MGVRTWLDPIPEVPTKEEAGGPARKPLAGCSFRLDASVSGGELETPTEPGSTDRLAGWRESVRRGVVAVREAAWTCA